MAKKRAKRVNPRRIPVSGSMTATEHIMAEAGKDNLYYAWLLLLSNLTEQKHESNNTIAELWDAIKLYNETHRAITRDDIHRAERLFGFCMPCRNVSIEAIRTAAELETVLNKLRKNAVAVAICALLLGSYHSGFYDSAALRRIYLNIELTLAEIENGSCTYETLLETLERHGMRLDRLENHRNMLTIETQDET